jgi:DNA-binding beta-propeller fold protein YncE
VLLDVPDRLYVASHVHDVVSSTLIGGRIRAIDLNTEQQVWSVDTGEDLDATLSPSGARLFLAADDGIGFDVAPMDRRYAINTADGSIAWNVPTSGRMAYIFNMGPATTAVSPDGSLLWLYKNGVAPGDSRVTYHIARADATNGQPLSGIVYTPGVECVAARMAVSPDGQVLYMTCSGDRKVRFINLAALVIEQELAILPNEIPSTDPGDEIVGALLAPGGGQLYVFTDNMRIAVVDTAQRVISHWVDLGATGYEAPSVGLQALSPDGSRLYLGMRSASYGFEHGYADEIRVFSTSTWQQVANLQTNWPLAYQGGSSLAVRSDDQFVYALTTSMTIEPPTGLLYDTVVKVNTATGDTVVLDTFPHEDTQRILIGP